MHNSCLHTQHNWGCNEHRRPGRDLARSRVWYVRCNEHRRPGRDLARSRVWYVRCNEHRRPGRDLARSRVWYVRWLKFSSLINCIPESVVPSLLLGIAESLHPAKLKAQTMQALLTDCCVRGHNTIISHLTCQNKECFSLNFGYSFHIPVHNHVYLLGCTTLNPKPLGVAHKMMSNAKSFRIRGCNGTSVPA